MADIENILQEDEQMNEEQLMKYLQGKLSDDELHAVEKQMADSDFMNDAVEGLQSFRSKKNIEEFVGQLNHQLLKQTALKVRRKEKRRLKKNDWITLAVILVLLLSLLGYVVIHKLRNSNSLPAQQTQTS